MINLDKEFCSKVQEARRKARIPQTVLAREIGCHQSAISALEQGDGTKLNDEAIEKIAKKFGIEVPKAANNAQFDGTAAGFAKYLGFTGESFELRRGFCPNPECLSNRKYEVSGRVLAMPDREKCDPVNGTYCAICGEVLEKRCPTCGAPVHNGAICQNCGNPYVSL